MIKVKQVLLTLAATSAISGCSGDTPPDTPPSGGKSSPTTTKPITKPKPNPKPEITKPATTPTKPTVNPKPDTKPTLPEKPDVKPKLTAPRSFNLQSISPSASASQTTFSWERSESATNYTLCLRDETKPKSCHIVATTKETSIDVNGLGVINSLTVPYFVIASNAQGEQLSNEKSITPQELTSLTQYIKASNTGDGDGFGDALSLSSDGRTLAVGALWEASNATGINGDETDNSAIEAGAVYLYRFDSGYWTQQAYLKASNTDDEDYFGTSVSLSSDGNTLAIGAPGEASSATGVNGSQADNSEAQSGAVYLFRFDSGVWLQQTYIKASETKANDNFGTSLALSSNGNTLAVGKYQQESVYLFQFASGSWSQQAKLKGSNTESTDNFGSSISLSSDGLTLAVGATGESSNATGIDGDGTDNSEFGSGAVYIFRLDSGAWSQEAYIKASNTHSTDNFGSSVSLSSNGHTLAVGAKDESSNATGVNGVQSDNSAPRSGSVFLFRLDSGTWSQQAHIKASTPDIRDNFGVSVSLSHDGNTLAVGAHGEASSATGVNRIQSDNSAPRSGAAYLFKFDSGAWTQQAYIKASNAEARDNFGYSVSLSSDGNALAVGAASEASNATGVNGNQADNSASYSGAVYVH